MKEEELSASEDKPPSQVPLGEPSVLTLPIGQVRPMFPQEQWYNWQWQMANRLRSHEDLISLLRLSPLQAESYKSLIKTFHYSITPYYLSLINWHDPKDPIRMQCVPDSKEMNYAVVGNADPLEEEKDMQVPGLVHRYPDRVLALVTGMCAMYCRHCTRKRIWNEGEWMRTRKELAVMVSYIRKTRKVREVIISGGDPLLMNLDTLDWFLGELRRIHHVEVLRIGTRVPVVLPMRITEELTTMLKQHRPLWINTQFNHYREITLESAAACDRIQSAGIPISNQSVLLKDINDSTETMIALCHALQRIMVRPYYLYQCDPVVGAEHFRTNVFKGIQIIEEMRGHTGGLCIPSFVVDAPGGGGKIPLQPFYLLSIGEQEIMLRNYEGLMIRYFNPKENEAPRASSRNRRNRKTESVVYCDNSRQIRRHKKCIVDISHPGKDILPLDYAE